jgi:fibronectin type 3 domain-containing protein
MRTKIALTLATGAALVTMGVSAPGVQAADTTAPTQPGPITVSGISAAAASLKWTASSDNVGIEGYRVYRGPEAAANTALSLIATTDAVTSYRAANLRSGFAYKFGVVAIDAANNKSAMRTTTVTTLTSSDTAAPAAPSSTSVVLSAFSSTRVDLVWAASTSTDIAYYEVYRDGTLTATVEKPNSQRFSDNGLAPASSHSYVIRAVDSAGNRSAGTTSKTVKTLAAGVVKIARGPYLSNVTATSAIVSWWTNIPTTGVLSLAGQSLTDPAGTVQHHAVSATRLTSSNSYPYTVTSSGVSASGTLQTTAKPGQTFSFAAIGDFGAQSPGEAQNAANIGSAGTAFIQTLGDNIYPAAGLPDPSFSTTYSDFDARFFKQFGPVVKSQAFFPANGNKEYYGDGEFWDAFPMPGANHSWYSYNWGDAHVLVLDSEQPYAAGTEQYNFAQSDLAAHQGDPWRIVAIQRPPYSSTTSSSSSQGVRSILVPLFQAENVNLVLSGNSHNYERSFPLTNGSPAVGGITYIVSGAGGNGFNAFTSAFPQPAWSAFRQSSFYEYAKVTVNASSVTVAAVRADTNTVFDTTTITKPGSDATPPSAPTGLSAGTTTATTVPLTWNANPAADGVTGYNVYRDGVRLAAGTGVTGTSFTDSGLSPATTYSYSVTALDAANNESPQSAAAPATTAAGGGTTFTVSPTDDSTIDPVTTDTITASRVKVDASAPVDDMLLKFTIPASCSSVTAASLQLTVGSGSNDPSTHGGDFYATSRTDPNAGWSQASVTWASAPAKDSTIAPVVLATAVTAGTTYSINVSTLVPKSPATFTIRGTSTSADGAGYFSTEGSATSGPKLLLTCG